MDPLEYHQFPQPGKIGQIVTKPLFTQQDLGNAYTPGVAAVSRAISADVQKTYTYTNRGNTVAVVTDGSAVLGLGAVGPEAALPVMEGKAALFNHLADIDAHPLCFKHLPVAAFIDAVAALEPSFGGINLEDIKAPECFVIEEELIKRMNIPVFHDDQHGAAIIALAALRTSLTVVGKSVRDVAIVINGAGAAGLATARLLLESGIEKDQITVVDSAGVLTHSRKLLPHKAPFAQKTNRETLAQAVSGADIFIGFSVGGVLKKEMIRSMQRDPIIFALANPDPEISPEEARAAGARIVATGRSDFPNQLNNALGFPGIFRGALDCRAHTITLDMKMAAAEALSELASTPIPQDIRQLLEEQYPDDALNGMFRSENPLSENFILPKPLDPRVAPAVATAVAKAAEDANVHQKAVEDEYTYERQVANRIRNHGAQQES